MHAKRQSLPARIAAGTRQTCAYRTVQSWILRYNSGTQWSREGDGYCREGSGLAALASESRSPRRPAGPRGWATVTPETLGAAEGAAMSATKADDAQQRLVRQGAKPGGHVTFLPMHARWRRFGTRLYNRALSIHVTSASNDGNGGFGEGVGDEARQSRAQHATPKAGARGLNPGYHCKHGCSILSSN